MKSKTLQARMQIGWSQAGPPPHGRVAASINSGKREKVVEDKLRQMNCFCFAGR
jgi:hypothetical protein